MSNYKIIFTGPVGAGKTTAVSALSDIPTVRTDCAATDTTRERKAETTVAMDYGLVNLGEGTIVHLYGTPGQKRFDFMWDILTEGGVGLVLLLDNTRRNPMEDLHFFVQSFRQFIDRSGIAIGVTRMDLSTTPSIEDYHRELFPLGLRHAPVFETDARERRDVSLLVEALLCSLDPLATA